MANTPNYGLYKPDRADADVEVDTSLANNFTTIDTKIKANEDGLASHESSTTAHDSANITHSSGSVKTELDSLDTRVTDIETNGVGGGTIPDDLNNRLVAVETTNDTQDNRITDVENNVNGMLAPTTFDELANQTFDYDALRFGYVDNKLTPINTELDDHASQLAERASLNYPLEHYPKQGSETDDGARINRAIVDINSKGGGTIVFKTGASYTSSVPIMMLQGVKLDLNGATIKAIAPMTSLIDTDINTQLTDVTIKNGYVDATDKAQWAIRLQNFAIGWMDYIYAYNGTSGGIKLGTIGSPQTSYGMHMTRCQADRPRGTTYSAQPTGSSGILFENATDNTLIDSHGMGNETGIKMLNGCSGNVLFNSHNWARMPDNNMNVGFEIASTNNHFIGCISDTALQTGFKLSNWRNKFTNCTTYVNGQGNNTSVGFNVATGTQECSFIGCIFQGSDSTHTIANDFVFADDPQSNNNFVIGSSWTYTNTKTTSVPYLLSNYDTSKNIDLPFVRSNVALWKFRSNASNDNFSLVKYKSDGTFDRNAINYDRVNDILQFGEFIQPFATTDPTPNGTNRGSIYRIQDDTNGDRLKHIVRLGSAGTYIKTLAYTDSGTTAQRPINISVGYQYFDTTLGKPVWAKVGGATPTWVDSTGTTV